MYKLSRSNYELLKTLDLSDLKEPLVFYDEKLSFETKDLLSLLVELNLEIACNGMTDDKEYATEYGWQLYDLYDEILNQKREYQSE